MRHEPPGSEGDASQIMHGIARVRVQPVATRRSVPAAGETKMELFDELSEAIRDLDDRERYTLLRVVFGRTCSAIEQYDPKWQHLTPFQPIRNADSRDLVRDLPSYRRRFEELETKSLSGLGEGDSPWTIENALANVGLCLVLASQNELDAHWTMMTAGTSSQLMGCIYVDQQAHTRERSFQLSLARNRALLARYDDLGDSELRAILVPDHGRVIDYDVDHE